MKISDMSVDEWLLTYGPKARRNLQLYIDYMEEHHSDITPVISFDQLTYPLGGGKGRTSMGIVAGKNYVAIHSPDAAYLNVMREKLSRPGKAKGCVHFEFKNEDELAVAFEGIEELLRRAGLK